MTSSGPGRPTAVVAVTDGYDDIPEVAEASPHSRAEKGRRVGRLLMNGGTDEVVLPHELVPRHHSVGPPSV